MRGKYGLSYASVKFWRRYIDDVIIIWQGTREAFMEFYAKIQDVHNDIDFDEVAMEEPGKPLVALDVTLAIEQGSIVWRHYRKDTASDQVIHFRSAHDEGT